MLKPMQNKGTLQVSTTGIFWLALLLWLFAVPLAQASSAAQQAREQAQNQGLPHFSVVADGLPGLERVLGVLQPAKKGHRTRDLLLYPIHSHPVEHTDTADTTPHTGSESASAAQALKLSVSLSGLNYVARAEADEAYRVTLPVSPADEKVISGLSGQAGAMALQIHLSQGELQETLAATLNLDQVAAVEAAAEQPRRGPLPQVWLGGLATLLIFFFTIWQGFREQRGRKKH